MKWLYDLCPFPIADDTGSAGEGSSSAAAKSSQPSGKRGKKKGKQSNDDVIKDTWFSSTRSMLKSIVDLPWRCALALPEGSVVSLETVDATKKRMKHQAAQLEKTTIENLTRFELGRVHDSTFREKEGVCRLLYEHDWYPQTRLKGKLRSSYAGQRERGAVHSTLHRCVLPVAILY